MQPWIQENEECCYENRLFKVLKRRNRSPLSGKSSDFYVVSTFDWVNVVALTSDQRLVMVQQYRHGSNRVTLEIPGGAVDAGEEALQAAKRELREETGYASDQWECLGVAEPNPAIQNNRCTTFLALNARVVGPLDPDENEEIVVVVMPWSEVKAKVISGEIRHAIVLTALYFYETWKTLNG
jgi:8-oxo-dGTP pyrophosphatase MutT (NUDIX family)